MSTFNDFGFDPSLMEGIDSLGYTQPTPVQEQSIPVLLEGHDLIASAQTGTGKTAAFLLPVIQKIIHNPKPGSTRALILVPTRELALQIDRMMEGISYFTPVSSIAVFGGTDGMAFSREQSAMTKGADMLICTPGRLIAHLNMGYVKFDQLEFLVLDEADRMLDMGFIDDIMLIISKLPKDRQTMLFSATMPPKIRELSRKIMRHPREIGIAISQPAERVTQEAYVVHTSQKMPLFVRILKENPGKSILVFCSTKVKTRELSVALRKSGIKAGEMHSDLEQMQREEVLMQFTNRDLLILIATDVLARGIDIEDIDLIINFDVPGDAESYIHRIGRTARAASEGKAITLIAESEQHKFLVIEELMKRIIEKVPVPEEFGPAPEYRPGKKPAFRRKFGKPGKSGSFRKKS